MIDIAHTTVGIIGAGTMGQGIAQVCASAGYKVVLYDVKDELAKNGIEKISNSLSHLLAKGKVTADDKDAILSRMVATQDFHLLKGEVLIEAAVEDLEIKKTIFRRLEEINSPEALLLTNTSSIPVTNIGSDLKSRDRFAGLHFFNPAPVMKLVEIIQGSFTSSRTVERVNAFAVSLNKQAVIAQDAPGFIVNRVARLFYVEALKMLEEGVASHTTIDELMRNSGFRMGPFELMDLIGVDINLAVTKSIYEGFYHESRFRPSRIQQQKVDAGMLGRKSGKGFYDYQK